MASLSFGFGNGFFGSNPAASAGITVPPNAQPQSPAPSSGGGIWDTIFKFAQLGTSTYLATEALNNSKPATITYDALGRPVATGGGAILPSTVSAGITSWLPIIVIVVIVLLLVKR
jgi:hypothetical protein